MGLEQLALLRAQGVDLARVVVGHCDLKDNLEDILRMIDLGAYVQFDTIGKNNYYPDEKRIGMLHALRNRGLLNRVMLSMDITRLKLLKSAKTLNGCRDSAAPFHGRHHVGIDKQNTAVACSPQCSCPGAGGCARHNYDPLPRFTDDIQYPGPAWAGGLHSS
jgi:hypothetical protein